MRYAIDRLVEGLQRPWANSPTRGRAGAPGFAALQQFLVAAGDDLIARIASGEIDTEEKRKKLLDRYGEELERKHLNWENFQDLLVAGA